MKIEELRHALDDLAGDTPPADDALEGVTRRARKQRARTAAGIATVCALVIAVTTVGAVQLRSSNDHKVSVLNPSPSAGNVSDLTWSRVPTPAMNIQRIVTANGHTFAVGSSPDGKAAIGELDASGVVTSVVDPTAGYDLPVKSGSVSDLVGIPGALVAVGESVGVGAPHADAWRSTDGGHTWKGVAVETPPGTLNVTMSRVVVSKGVVYAVGTQHENPDFNCPMFVWSSDDGTDFRLVPGQIGCATGEDLANGPAGILVVTSGNATAWTRNGSAWLPHRIPTGAPDSNAHVFGVAGSDDGYVAVGSIGAPGGVPPNDLSGAIWWSANGKTWSRVATNAPDPRYPQAQFSAVAHSAAGWIAVGWQQHPGPDTTVSDAVVWTSPDGQHWTAHLRDGSTFEQYAWVGGVGATADGFAIFGQGNITATNKPNDPIRQDLVLWMGSSMASTTPLGILEGVMQEVGGPSPGLAKGVPGTFTATASDGSQATGTVDADGRFSTTLPPGSYQVVGHSPAYGNNAYDCTTQPTGRAIVRAGTTTHVELICSIR